MSSPPESLPDYAEGLTPAAPVADQSMGGMPAPLPAVAAEKPFPAWSGWDVLAVFFFALVTIIAFIAAAILGAHTLPAYRNLGFSDLKPYVPVAIAAQAAAYPVILLVIFFLVRTRSSKPFGNAISWNWPQLTAPLFLLGGTVLAFAIDKLARFLPTPKSLPMDQYFTDATSAYLMAGLGIVLAPLLEEMFFRGLLYPVLRRKLGLFVAVLLTALAFAAIHSSQLGYAWGPVLSIFIVGVVFTVVRVRTNSVAASFLLHCGYNLALFGALWLGTDHFRHLDKLAGG